MKYLIKQEEKEMVSAKRKMVKRGQYKIYNVYVQIVRIFYIKLYLHKKSELKYIKIKSIMGFFCTC